MFSLSLRVTGHPCVFHHTRVRSSTQFYLSFNLPVTRSLGFGSTTTNYKTLSGFSPFSDSVSLRLRRFHALTSLAIVTRRLILQKARHHTLADALTCCGFMVSGSLSLPSPGFFSPFPHGTSALSVVAEYLALDRGRPRFRQGFSCLAVLRYRITESYLFRLRGFHPLWPAFPEPFLYRYDFLLRGLRPCGPTTPASAGLGSSNFARRYFRNLVHLAVLLISLPGVREMVQFPQYCFRRLYIQQSDDRLAPAGLPHSAIQASQDVCSSTWLFAAYHGLLRLATPRHPPMNPSSLDHIIVPALTLVRTLLLLALPFLLLIL